MGLDLKFIVGLISGFVLSLIARYVFVRIDEVSARFDELCTSIADAADTATDYWLRGPTDAKLAILEAKIHGYQTRINLLFTLIEQSDYSIRALGEGKLDAFLDALTGGNFEVKSRSEDPEKARDAQMTGAELIVFLRSHRRRRLFPF